jgi:putative ABC transport system ATP-binding protein
MRNVSHYYGTGALRKQVLYNVNCDISAGEIVIIAGPSGSGKTTMLTLAGALRSVNEGSMHVLGHELNGATRDTLVRIRENIGFIFQAHNLLDSLTALQNVQISLGLHPVPQEEARSRSIAMLEAVGLGQRLDYLPTQLSIGQRQRVAVARALVRQPKIVLADEPTASLDKQSGRDIVELLRQLAYRQGCTVLLVTHDNRILDIADRIMWLEDGRLGSFGSAVSPFAAHLLTVLARVEEKEHLRLLVEPMGETEFLEFLKMLGGEVEQLLNIVALGSPKSVYALLENLLDAILVKAAQTIGAAAVGLFKPDGTALRVPFDIPSWPKFEIAARCVGTRSIVNAKNTDLGPGIQNVLCAPIRNRLEEIQAVVELVNKKVGDFTVDDERACRDVAVPLGFIVEAWQRFA